MQRSGVTQSKMLDKKTYLAPRLISYGSVAKLTKAKSGPQTDSSGGKCTNNTPPVRRF